MITYQVKITINPEVEEAWLKYMKTEHVPDVIATGLVRSFQILKPEIEEAHTYYYHYQFESSADYEKYRKEFAPKLKAHPQQKFPNQFTATRQLFKWV